MNSDQLLYLIDISKTNSINTTAKRLYTSQQAVSESIKRLEHELGCTILNRSKVGVTLTEDGKFVLRNAISIMNHYDTLLRHFEKNTDKPKFRGTLSIGIALLAANTFLKDLIFFMRQKYPDIILHTQELAPEFIIELLLAKKLDFGITGFSEDDLVMRQKFRTLSEESIHIQKLYTDHLVCVMSKNNPLTMQNDLTNEQLFSIDQTMYNYNAASMVAIDHCLHISSSTAIHQKFMQEAGTVCSMPYRAFEQLYSKKDFICLPITDSAPVSNYLLYRQDADKNEQLYQAFIRTIMSFTATLS